MCFPRLEHVCSYEIERVGMREIKPSSSGFAEIRGARLYYEMAGEGEPLVLLHAGLLDRRMWDDQFQSFARDYQVVRYDVRGGGNSENLALTAPYFFHQDLHDLLTCLDIKQASLVGVSLGSRTAIDMAIAYPEMVYKLVLASPGLGGYQPTEVMRSRGKEMVASLRQGNIPQAIELFLNMWADGPNRTSEQISTDVRQRIREMVTHSISKNILGQGIPPDLEPPAVGRLSEIHAPTMILLGDQDFPDIIDTGRLLNKGIAGSEVVILPDVAHILNMEAPEEFHRLVHQFLQQATDH
jgi:3-oxoadipate enol-lactonase